MGLEASQCGITQQPVVIVYHIACGEASVRGQSSDQGLSMFHN